MKSYTAVDNTAFYAKVSNACNHKKADNNNNNSTFLFTQIFTKKMGNEKKITVEYLHLDWKIIKLGVTLSTSMASVISQMKTWPKSTLMTKV